MSGLFVDNDGKMNWKGVGYRARSAFAVILSLAVLIGGGWFAYSKINSAYQAYKTADDYPGPGVKDIVVTIPRGSTTTDIGNILIDQGVVKSMKAFKNAASDQDMTKVQAGRYKLKTELPAATAITMLLDPKNRVRVTVTIPEGLWLAQQFTTISKSTGIKVPDLQAEAKKTADLGLPSWAKGNAEGFLFPDTYEVDTSPTAGELLPTMVDEFNSVSKSLDFENKANAMKHTPLQVLTVASIVQAEVGNSPKYMPQVASVLYNRLKAGQKLELDTTVHYAVQKAMNVTLTSADMTNPSPYNTYVHNGLPPGPINAPGKAAMQAALNPSSTDYLYFVTVNLKTGETRFAKTYAEHQKNVALFNAFCKATPMAGCPNYK